MMGEQLSSIPNHIRRYSGDVADYAGESLARVREALKRADAGVVSQQAAALTQGLPKRRRPGRPRGSTRTAPASEQSSPVVDISNIPVTACRERCT